MKRIDWSNLSLLSTSLQAKKRRKARFDTGMLEVLETRVLLSGTDPGRGDIEEIVNGSDNWSHTAVTEMIFNFGAAGTFTCTGTLISPTHILTAAHCVMNNGNLISPSGVTARFHDTNGNLTGTYSSVSVIAHPQYNDFNFGAGYDLAIVELSQPVQGVTPMEILRTAPIQGETLTLVGYGQAGTTNNYNPSEQDKQVGTTALESVTNLHLEWIFDGDGEANTAPGDSGGPAFVVRNNELFIAGVTSGGAFDAFAPNGDSFDTRIDVFAQWIDDNSTGAGDPDDEISEALPVTAGTYNGTISDSDDVDMYAITVEAGQFITVQANETAGGLNPRLRLFDANGNQLADSDDVNGTNSEIQGTFNLDGTFYLAVGVHDNTGYDPSTGDGDNGTGVGGDYELVITTSDPNDQISEAIPFNIGSTVSGSINPDTSDVDMYSITVDAGATLNFSARTMGLNNGELIPRIRIFDGNGQELANLSDAPQVAFDYTFNASGTYYVGISDLDNGAYNPIDGTGDTDTVYNGDYNLTISWPDLGSDVIARLGGNWWVARSNETDAFNNVYYGAWDPNAGWNNVQTGDFNNDGLTDVAGRSSSGQLWVAINTGSGFNTQLWGYLVPSLGIQDLMVADVNGDGNDDLVGRSSTGQWWVAKSNGSNGFANELWGGWVESAGWDNVMVADLNGDGNEDIIGRANNGQWWAAQSTGTSFTTEYWGYWVPSLNWQDIQVADVDNDGDSDIVGRSDTGSWWVARSNGSIGSNSFDNEFWGGWVESAGWNNVMVIDLDGDGNDDIIGQANNGQWWAARSNGTAFSTEYWGYWVDLGWHDVQVIDVDQDGNQDVVGLTSSNALWIAHSNGVDSFANELWGGFSGTGWTNVMVGNAGFGGNAPTALVDLDDDDKLSIFG